MSVIFLLIAIGIIVAGGFLAAFIWSVKSGQYDDDYTPSVRMLFDNYKAEEVSEKQDSESADTKAKDESHSNKNKS